ncbi:MAG TPA: IS200/IS605 family transposase [Candidatus Cloacimonas acidaminovorans]|nr:IS200/IS605 family transposase [Candidatus Cloacimonas acidaminovorans]
MPASFCHIAVHIIFSTKNRKTWLKKPLAEEMYAYLYGIIINLKGIPISIGGIEDHIHILCLAPKELSMVDFMVKLKANSSKWFREKTKLDFHWQDGYAAFSVSKSNIDDVKDYIEHQADHHHNITVEEEFNALLQKHWDPNKLREKQSV